jgi:uncharacterized protein (TIGR02001 family)
MPAHLLHNLWVHVYALAMTAMHPKKFISRYCTLSQSDKLFVALAFVLLCSANDAVAQFSGSAALVSDYRYRGVSLSQGNPEPQLSLSYDHPDGWYAGGLVSGVNLEGAESQQLVAYGGYSRVLNSELFPGVSWEGGISSTTFRQASDYNYSEAYIGLTSGNYSARVYYSPSYFYQNARTVYAEFNAAYTLRDNLELTAHAGLLDELSNSDTALPGTRYDCRFGIATRINDWNVQLAVTALQKKSTYYPHYEDQHPKTLLLSVAYSF